MFNLFRGFVFLWLSCIGIVHAADTGWLVSPQNDHARIRFQAEREQTHIKGLLTVELKPGWKTYWRSPGEGGVAPKISWPEGVTDSWSWPVPSRFDISGMTTQGYHDKVTIPITLDGVKGDTLDGTLTLSTCSNVCLLTDYPLHLDFTQPVDPNWVQEKLELGGFESQWEPVLTEWITAVLQAPLNETGVSLSQLSDRDKQVEMEFYLPIASPLRAEALDALIREYDPLSAGCPPLNFRQVQGMLKGFIDLVFRHEGRYYLLDYKSNWLGENSEAYTQQAMASAMQMHRYDLQYQLYTLALHRYLRHRIADYRYEEHFGGVIYLFLRGVDAADPRSGIFSTRPHAALIEKMDNLFAANAEEVA